MRILIACEQSGKVRDAFTRRGHFAMSCDLSPSATAGPHYQGSVLNVLCDGWDMMIGHPPCTYLCNSGVRWLTADRSRWHDLDEGAAFFNILWTAGIPRIALENPIPHKYAVQRIGAKYDQLIQPWQFGHMESKATCLWLKGLAPLVETDNVKADMLRLPVAERNRIHRLPPGPDRARLRSETYQGIANAMAAQWGNV